MKKLMLGNEAIARGAYEAGVTVATAYPGTPSTEITESIAKYHEVYAEWSPNEKVALEVAIGSSIGGARALCSMKHVGLNVAADPLFTVSYTGINGGLVIVVADDPGMHSSQNEQDSRRYAKAAKIPMLEPSSSQECKEFVKEAYEISERFDCPVIIRLSTRIAHSQDIVEINERCKCDIKDYIKDINKYVMVPAIAKVRHIKVESRMNKLVSFSESSQLNNIEWGKRNIGIISSGIAYQYAREVFKDVSYLKIGMVYPLPREIIERFANKVEELYVIEELEPFIEEYIKELGIKVIGKEVLPMVGELNSEIINNSFSSKKPTVNKKIAKDIIARPPAMCPGCPHRGIFYVLKKLKLNVSGDIGCYSLGALLPLRSIDSCICMGASIGIAHGMEKARGTEFINRTVAILGDSTFIHSGITGLIDIVYNKGNSTVIILDNAVTAMTGYQSNPTTGYNIKNEATKKVELEKLCRAVGVERIKVVDPFNVDEVESVVKEEIAACEPSVIIARRECERIKEHKSKAIPLKVNQSKCVKCRKCLEIGCPCICIEDEDIVVNKSLCIGCKLCMNICKMDAFEEDGDVNEEY
ncbi:indolepyruvate ferredoxin oxidoreductase alpha subunit [Clostridium acetobutylicum]|uniref:Indolepyruvate oxidoreductase subunit IorA n=1 Tax=Clostridium acetobutylicum (strain ATCC 824 / DSM 792 / JCM 1419 / IAM 19013 / LMG 5710 / NBRC 13948 / NRRL B-527 / VKM B-1787 / 2291 / W) TaxID=272562 RepID=Q97HL0_CLOAB|nr:MULTISPECIES: indolepyruvate ferredoxin oxidoreductase subunit alpha [Clostridium]AAK79960.1 Indolepyruvate ferredoxin oxidoreductase, subunit alpha [Clostridium acetobutylicum ATCC 824]ADZ21053.1 Indolepyruvate ferredoxin oxidoreductase, subunit alpha [Clostridium acetobutylicum EA 2018]AEI33567.1 indolepyruvate ferredoxin oxidoreductase, subunit alpha [Clostridium acetobutylicum DSM 1731]AWV79608.1 indolepyruvate ferredoxin oxidoreductase subunit alpha [Clostridium acetobutylicum]MBC23944